MAVSHALKSVFIYDGFEASKQEQTQYRPQTQWEEEGGQHNGPGSDVGFQWSLHPQLVSLRM